MRKMFFVLVAAFAMSFTACNKNAEPAFGTATDSVNVDSTDSVEMVDSLTVDTVAAVDVDTTVVDSVK